MSISAEISSLAFSSACGGSQLQLCSNESHASLHRQGFIIPNPRRRIHAHFGGALRRAATCLLPAPVACDRESAITGLREYDSQWQLLPSADHASVTVNGTSEIRQPGPRRGPNRPPPSVVTSFHPHFRRILRPRSPRAARITSGSFKLRAKS